MIDDCHINILGLCSFPFTCYSEDCGTQIYRAYCGDARAAVIVIETFDFDFCN